MATVEKYLLGSISTLLSTELNALISNGQAIGSAYSNVVAGAGDGSTLCDLELIVTFGTAPAVNTGIAVWFVASADSTNYEDGDASITPARAPDVVFPVRAVTTAQRIGRRVWMPWGLFKPLLRNDGTGQTFAATGNLLKIRPAQRQGI